MPSSANRHPGFEGAPLDIEAIGRRVTGALLRLRARSPFFGALSLFARFIATSGVPTAGTDGRDVFYNPAFLAPLTNAELDGLLLHEVLHAALRHAVRRGSRERVRWNVAADIVVNGIVAVQPGLLLPKGGVRAPQLEQFSVEELYALLTPKDLQTYACSDCLTPPEDSDVDTSPATIAKLESHWNVALRHAQAVARSMSGGELPKGMDRIFHQIEPKLDWRTHLWRFLARTPTDFGDFDRRFVHRGLYLEGLDGESLRAFIAVDTSGSVDGPLLDMFAGEVRGVLGAYPHIQAQLFYTDHHLYGPYEVTRDSPFPAPVGGGGTRFWPFFKHVETENQPGPPSVLIYLTDGFGEFPDWTPDFPVLWVVPSGGADDAAFPFGEVVRLIEDEGDST